MLPFPLKCHYLVKHINAPCLSTSSAVSLITAMCWLERLISNIPEGLNLKPAQEHESQKDMQLCYTSFHFYFILKEPFALLFKLNGLRERECSGRSNKIETNYWLFLALWFLKYFGCGWKAKIVIDKSMANGKVLFWLFSH